jgi:RNA polymerase sigma factor (TIGR02999 family)
LLTAWVKGDKAALPQLVSLVYPELRRIARRHIAVRQPDQSLESSDLANEAYLKLLRVEGVRCENRIHFLALCAQIVRHVLVDHARKRRYKKRGGNAVKVPLDENLIHPSSIRRDVLDLDDALGGLSKLDPRKASFVILADLRWRKSLQRWGCRRKPPPGIGDWRSSGYCVSCPGRKSRRRPTREFSGVASPFTTACTRIGKRLTKIWNPTLADQGVKPSTLAGFTFDMRLISASLKPSCIRY